MKILFINFVKTAISKEGNGNITFKSIEAFINGSADRHFAILSVWIVLREEQNNSTKSWSKWYEKFFTLYEKELRDILGFPFMKIPSPPFLIKRPKEFIEKFGELKKSNAISSCSYEVLAVWIRKVFLLSYLPDSICTMLKDLPVK